MELQVVGRLVGNGLGTLVVRDSKDLILDLYNTIFLVQTSYANIAIALSCSLFLSSDRTPYDCFCYLFQMETKNQKDE
ncbi:hypothetical protein V6N13_026116 [Hibiscus sabdariffa]